MIDIAKLPLPPADYEPTVADWRRYQDVVRPLVEVELLSQLRRHERELIKRGWKELDVCMDYELGYDIYMDKLRTARVLAFAREQQAARAIPRQPAEVPPEPSLDLVDPAVMHWSPTAEDLEWMERALSPKASTRRSRRGA